MKGFRQMEKKQSKDSSKLNKDELIVITGAGGFIINERNVGKLYRHFLALLGASSQSVYAKLEATVEQYGGLIWAIDALQPEGDGTLLYVLYEVLSGRPVAALQREHVSEQELAEWLRPYQELPFPVLATLSDGEATLVATLKSGWPQAPHQRCQAHFLSNLAEEVLDYDDQLRQNMRQDLGGLPAVPEHLTGELAQDQPGPKDGPPPF